MRRRLLTLVVLGAALLAAAALCAAPALADSGRSDTLVLRNLGHGKASLVVFASSASSLTPTTVWSGALPAGAKLAAGSFDGAAADEALVLSPHGRSGARLYLFSPGATGYLRTTLWNTTKAGFSVTAAKLVAADINRDGRDELVVLVPRGARGARLLCFAWNGKKLKRTTLWSASRAPFAVGSTSLAAGDLNGDGKADLLLFSQLKTRATLRGFVSTSIRLVPHWSWSAHLPANTRLACGVPDGAGRFAAWLVSPTSSASAALYSLEVSGRKLTVRRTWAGALRLRGAQVAAVDLAGSGPVDLLALCPRGTQGATFEALVPQGSSYRAARLWSVKKGLAVSRASLACAPSLAGVLGPMAVALSGTATASLKAASPDLSTLTFTGAAPAGATINRVIVAGPSTLAPQGILRTVTGVQTSGGQTTLTTAPASLDQAFSSLDVACSHQLDQSDFADLKLARGVRLLGVQPGRRAGPLGTKVSLPSFTVAIDQTIDGLHLTGSLTLNERVDLNAKISLLGGLRSASVSSTSTEHGSLGATASKSWDEKKQVKLHVASWPIVVPTPLGVPIEINADLYIVVGAKASFEVGVTTDVHEDASFTIGASYAGGHFAPIVDRSFSSGCTSPTIYGTAQLKAYMGPELDTTLYDVAGPTVEVDGYGAFDADTSATPWWTLHGGLEGSVGFVMQIFSHTVASWSLSQTFYDHVFAHAPSGSTAPPEVTTQPGDQTVNEGDTATFTAAASGSPSPTVQWQLSTDGGNTWSDLAGATSAAYAFTASSGENTYEYQAVFTNSQGSATTTAATLIVNPGKQAVFGTWDGTLSVTAEWDENGPVDSPPYPTLGMELVLSPWSTDAGDYGTGTWDYSNYPGLTPSETWPVTALSAVGQTVSITTDTPSDPGEYSIITATLQGDTLTGECTDYPNPALPGWYNFAGTFTLTRTQ